MLPNGWQLKNAQLLHPLTLVMASMALSHEEARRQEALFNDDDRRNGGGISA
jgi:hypothetical protein